MDWEEQVDPNVYLTAAVGPPIGPCVAQQAVEVEVVVVVVVVAVLVVVHVFVAAESVMVSVVLFVGEGSAAEN